MTFNIGDRVKYVGKNKFLKDKPGTVRDYDELNYLQVTFDREGSCNVDSDNLILFSSDPWDNLNVGDEIKGACFRKTVKNLSQDKTEFKIEGLSPSFREWYTIAEAKEKGWTILPPEEKKEEWPHYGQDIWFIDAFGQVDETTYLGSTLDEKLVKFGNCFRTKEEAEEALERVKLALKKI